MKELLGYLEYARLLVFATLGIMVITYIVHRIFKEYRWAKYIPGLTLIVVGFYGFITLIIAEDWIKGIFSMATMLIGLGTGVMGLFFALILGVYNKATKVDEAAGDEVEVGVEEVEVETETEAGEDILVEKVVGLGEVTEVIEDGIETDIEILAERLIDIEEEPETKAEVLAEKLIDMEEVRILEKGLVKSMEEVGEVGEEILAEKLMDIEAVEETEEAVEGGAE